MRKKLHRRTLLRCAAGGAAATIALPRLEAMFTSDKAFAQEGVHPRFISFYVPNGIIEDQWYPDGPSGTNYDLTGTALEPLEAHRGHLSILRNLRSAGLDGTGNGHMRGISGFLTGAAIPNDAVATHRISIDQIIGDHYEAVAPTRIHSLQLAGNNELDSPLNNQYNNRLKNSLSFDREGRILPNTANLRAVYDRLFAGSDVGATDEAAARRALMRQSVLDHVGDERERLVMGLGTSDRLRVEEYFDAIRGLERLIEAPSDSCDAGERGLFPVYADGPRLAAIGEHARQTAMLIGLAFACDLTRSVTYMAGGEAAGCMYSDIGINQHFHNNISHDRANKEHLHHQIDTFHSELVAGFLDVLQSTSSGEGTLLDKTLLLYGSGLGDGDQHLLTEVATLVAGRVGRFANGRYHNDLGGRPNGVALMNILEEMEIPATGIGDNTDGSRIDLGA